MLSSLGTCRDRSPSRDQPPSKIFVQYQEGEKESQTQSTSQSGVTSQPETQPAVRAKVPISSQMPLEVPSVVLETQQCSQPVPMIVVQDYEEEKGSPQSQIPSCEKVKDSQSIELKSQKVVKAQPKSGIVKEHCVESQTSSTQHVTQQLEENQRQVQSPIPSQPSQNLQKVASKGPHEQQLTTQAHVQIQQQDKPQSSKQQMGQASMSTQSQLHDQLETQSQKDITGQNQAPKQKRKAKKSQANLQNRPWLQQRSQLEIVTPKTAQEVPQSQPKPVYKGQISSQAPPQHIVAAGPTEAQGPSQSSVTAQSKYVVESDEKCLKQNQPVAQEKVTQRLAQTEPVVPAQSMKQKQPQQSMTVTNHQVLSQPQPATLTQAQATLKTTHTAPIQQQKLPHIVTSQQPDVMIPKQVQPQFMTPMQPQVMPQWQPQQTIIQSHPAVPKPQRFPVTQAMPQGISRPVQQYPTPPMQPQMIMQRQQSPHGAVQTQSQILHSPTIIPPHSKGASPIQPRIISIPQPQMPVQTKTQAQLKAQGNAPLMTQPEGKPLWCPPSDGAQNYPKIQGPVSAQMQSLAHFQIHPQFQSFPPAQPEQWSPIRPGIVAQTYPTVQVSGQAVQPQPQLSVYPKTQPQPQPQQWHSPRPESPWSQSQIRPQDPVHHWRPVSPESVSSVYPRAETQGQGPHPQSQYQSLPRPQSPQQQWGPVRTEHQFQVSSQTILHEVPHPIAPWNQPTVKAPIRPQSPQQLQQSQQPWGPYRTEAPSESLIQSQAAQGEFQSQDLTKPQLPVQEPPQQQSTPRVKQPALAQAPPQAYTEAYIKAQALVRDRFEEAKHCLQEHILEAISVFKDKRMTDEQVSVKEVCLFYS